MSLCRHQPAAPTILPGRDAKSEANRPKAIRQWHQHHRSMPTPGRRRRRSSRKKLTAKAGLRSPSRQEPQGYHRVMSFSHGGSRCCRGQAGFPAHPHMLRPACGFAPANRATIRERCRLTPSPQHPAHGPLHRTVRQPLPRTVAIGSLTVGLARPPADLFPSYLSMADRRPKSTGGRRRPSAKACLVPQNFFPRSCAAGSSTRHTNRDNWRCLNHALIVACNRAGGALRPPRYGVEP